jgi:type IV secretory pathway TraG/TraD family ATPase VirD4
MPVPQESQRNTAYRRNRILVINLLNHLWIAMPIAYALTVGGLIAGFRRGGIAVESSVPRALFVGLPVLLGSWILWNIIIAVCEAPGAPGQFDGLNLLLAFVFIPCSSALTGVTLARRKHTNPVERGTVIIDDRAQKPHTRRPGEVTLVGRLIPLPDETKHFKIMGTTGTGKSTAIGEILTGALARGDRAVIADPYGSYSRQFCDPARGDVILNPFDTRAARWDLFAEIIEPHDADQLARSLIPDHDGQDRIWRGYARTLLTAALRQIHRTGERNLGTLYSVLVTANEEDLRDLLEGTPAAPFVSKDNGKFLGSVRSVAMQQLAVIDHLLHQAEGEAFSVRKWIREGRGILFLPYSANEIASLRNVISTWMRLAIFETMSLDEGDHRLWFIVDELEALGPIDGLKDALARLRKFGGRVVLGFQSIAQVRGTYGDSEAQTIVENCGTTVILRCSASERGGTAEFASRLIGRREVMRKQLSYSRPWKLLGFLNQTRTVTDHITTEDAVMASEIEQLPDLSGFLKMASRPEWHRVTLSLK